MYMWQQNSPLLLHCVWIISGTFLGWSHKNLRSRTQALGIFIFLVRRLALIDLLLSVCFMSYSYTLFSGRHCFPQLFINLFGCELIYRELILFFGEAQRDQCFSVPCMQAHTAHARSMMEN